MPRPPSIIHFFLWGGLGLIVLGIVAVWLTSASPNRPLPVYGAVTNFSLTDQDGRPVSEADWHGRICVVDLIFTRCPGPCPIVSATLRHLQDALPSGPAVRLFSLTSDPAYDTPPVLKKYAEKFGARSGVWSFLAGPKEMMRHLAVEQLKLSLVDKPPAERESATDLVIHSTKLVLLDQQGRIRGYYDGETTECIPAILDAIQKLNQES